MAFKFLEGRPRGTFSRASTASTAYTIGQPVKLTNNIFVTVAPGDKVFGLVATAKSASDTSTDAIEVYPVTKSDVVVGDIGTGTMSDSVVDTGAMVDLKTGAVATVDLTATTANDLEVIGWDGSDTTKGYFTFQNTVF